MARPTSRRFWPSPFLAIPPTRPEVLPSPTPTATPIPATPTATVEPGSCTGDGGGDGVVTIDELLKAVNIVLGNLGVEMCSAVDRNDSGDATINELVLAVGAAPNGC